jgi:hypothetical protein
MRYSVIPVKTGIQSFQYLGRFWIPACAGMTTFYEFINIWAMKKDRVAVDRHTPKQKPRSLNWAFLFFVADERKGRAQLGCKFAHSVNPGFHRP